MADTKEGVKDEKADYINLKVLAQDNTEVHFKIKRSTPLKKLMDAYCSRQGLDKQNVRFMLDGQRINDTDTPETLDMEDNDAIDVMTQQTGGAC
eukprot:m.14441 g.14441  ORF g.14441 m.14441 type:complete len:94 (+) comp4799_c0_seq1:1404-1685(+)